MDIHVYILICMCTSLSIATEINLHVLKLHCTSLGHVCTVAISIFAVKCIRYIMVVGTYNDALF